MRHLFYVDHDILNMKKTLSRVIIVLFVALSGIGVLLLGYFLMDRLDKSLRNGTIVSKEQATRKQRVAALVMPPNSSIVNQISQWLMDKDISFIVVDDEYIPYNIDYQYSMAFSDNDLKNLLFSETARHENPEVIMIARCNNPIYHRIYTDIGVQKIFNGKVSQQDLALFLKGEEFKF